MPSDPFSTAVEPTPAPSSNGYQRLVALLLMPLASALSIAAWTLYAMLAIDTLYVLIPLISGGVLAFPLWHEAQRASTSRLMLWLLAGVAVALGLFGVASAPWEFLLLGVGLGLGGGVIATGAAHACGWLAGGWLPLAAGLGMATVAGVGFSLRLVPLVVQAYGWRAAPLSLLVPLSIIMLLVWLFAEAPEPARTTSLAPPPTAGEWS